MWIKTNPIIIKLTTEQCFVQGKQPLLGDGVQQYLQAVAGGRGENLTCFASWFGVHGDGTMEL